jgi:hypothetical protein
LILAIVGTRVFSSPRGLAYAELLISYEVLGEDWTSFVTGDAPGIDAMAKRICDENMKPCQVLAPQSRRWEPDGFKARNIRIATIADEMLCIRDPGTGTYGSGWTADHMDSLGKPVTRVVIT